MRFRTVAGALSDADQVELNDLEARKQAFDSSNKKKSEPKHSTKKRGQKDAALATHIAIHIYQLNNMNHVVSRPY